MRSLFLALLLTGCTTVNMPPSQKQQQEQTSTQTSSQTATQGQDTNHSTDSRQGTVSQPIIVICNTMGSTNSQCATPRDDEKAMIKAIPLKN